jgi:hypothetical protein
MGATCRFRGLGFGLARDSLSATRRPLVDGDAFSLSIREKQKNKKWERLKSGSIVCFHELGTIKGKQ